ncbi:UNVERIFIED_ORG: protein phosphatase [Bacillus sp. AZ43]
MGTPWDPELTGVLVLPSGRRVRGRGLREPAAAPRPDLGLYLLPRPPAGIGWETRWVRWRDFGLPTDPAGLSAALRELWERAPAERVEVACRGGSGRTGTALACLAVIDGVPPGEAVAFVREHYRRRAVETPGQRAFVERFTP